MDLEYGKYGTYEGNRVMIADWDDTSIKIFDKGVTLWVLRAEVTDISDFSITDAERKALGYAF